MVLVSMTGPDELLAAVHLLSVYLTHALQHSSEDTFKHASNLYSTSGSLTIPTNT